MPSKSRSALIADPSTPVDSTDTPTVHAPRSGRRRTAAAAAPTPATTKPAKSKSTVKPATTPLATVEADMLTKLLTIRKIVKDPTLIDKPYLVKTFPKFVKLTDAGLLRFYNADRWGSSHDNDWISDALIARLRSAVRKSQS